MRKERKQHKTLVEDRQQWLHSRRDSGNDGQDATTVVVTVNKRLWQTRGNGNFDNQQVRTMRQSTIVSNMYIFISTLLITRGK